MNKPIDDTLLHAAAGEVRWQREYAEGMGSEAPVRNRSGIAIKPLYTPRDWSGEHYESDLGYPGAPPYTRGIYATMHRGRTWSQRQLIGLGAPAGSSVRT
jgi:methylmalonyl-CoA mutase N-terminal domain/subunit